MSQIFTNFKLLLTKTNLVVGSALLLTIFLPQSNTLTMAGELSNGQTAFEGSLRLINTYANFTKRGNSLAKYYFTLEISEDAGEPLKAIKIEQRKYFADIVEFKTEESSAFIGDRFARGEKLSLAAVETNAELGEGEVTVIFGQPVSPGNTVTVVVKPKRNPRTGGVYLFGLTAYPEGEDSLGKYLGSGRLHISHR